MSIPFLIILNHFFADFVCQTDKMAINKSKSLKWLTIHILAYWMAMYPFMLYMNYLSNGNVIYFWTWGNPACIYWLVINCILHWITDYFTSRLNSYLIKIHESDKKKELLGFSYIHLFYVGVGIDQVIHYGCLLFTYEYFMTS